MPGDGGIAGIAGTAASRDSSRFKLARVSAAPHSMERLSVAAPAMLHSRASSPQLARSACTSRSTSSWMAATRGKNARSDSRCDWNSCRAACSFFASPAAARAASACFAISLQDRASASRPAACARASFSACSSACFSACSACATTSCPRFFSSISCSFFCSAWRSFCASCRVAFTPSSRPFSGVNGRPTITRARHSHRSPPRTRGTPAPAAPAAARCGRARAAQRLDVKVAGEVDTQS